MNKFILIFQKLYYDFEALIYLFMQKILKSDNKL